MYTVVLAVAITAAPATTSWQRGGGCVRACHSCAGQSGFGAYGGYVPYGSYGCTGGSGGARAQPQVMLFGGAGAGYGFHGGCYGAGYGSTYYFDPAMSGSTGCYGCHGGQSGYGVPVPSAPDPEGTGKPVDPFPPQPEIKKDPKGAEEIAPPKEVKPKQVNKLQLEQNFRAIVRVHIPEGGKLYVDGRHINVAAGTRVFQTPDLKLGERYFYDMKVEMVIDGILRKNEQRVIVERGQEVAVDFPSLHALGTLTARRQK